MAATGGVLGRMVDLVERGSGLYSWALPVTLSGLLKEAQVETLSTGDLASLMKSRGLADLGHGLPTSWSDAALRAAADAGRTGRQAGFVLIASWNTRVPQAQWNDDTKFWLLARLRHDGDVKWDTRLPVDPASFYRLRDYDLAVRDLAEKIIATIDPDELARVRSREVWSQRITPRQVELLAEAERDVAAGNLLGARQLLLQAHLAVQGREGSLLAFRRLIEVSEALREQDPARARQIGQEMEQEGRRRKAQLRRELAWACLYEAEGFRLQEKWADATDDYFEWVKYLVRQKRLDPAEVLPAALRADLNAEEPDLTSPLRGASAQAQWWATVALALYRGVSGDLAKPFFQHAAAVAASETDPALRGAALVGIARQQERASFLTDAENQYHAALKILDASAPGCDACAEACGGLGRLADERGDSAAALKWLGRAMDLRKSKPQTLQFAETANDIAVVELHANKPNEALAWSNRARGTLEKIAPISLDVARVYNTIGEAHLSRGETTGALDAFNRALSIIHTVAPGSAEYIRVSNDLGDVYLSKGERDKAAAFYGQAIANAANVTARLPRGDLDSRRSPALDLISQAIPAQRIASAPISTGGKSPLDSKQGPALENFGAHFSSQGFDLLLQGRDQEALADLRRAAKISPDDPGAQLGLAWGYVALRQFPAARPILDALCARGLKALAPLIDARQEKLAKQLLAAGNPAGYYLLGRIWEVLAEPRKAAAAYSTFLAKAPADHVWRADCAARLAKLNHP